VILKNTIKIILIAIILYFLFNGIDLEKVIESFKEISFFGFIFTVSAIILGDMFFAYRWKVLLFHKCSFRASFESVIISSFLNMILPAKLGEVSKVLYLKKVYNLSVSDTTAITIIEKFFDLFWMSIMAFIATLYIFDDLVTRFIVLGIIILILVLVFFVKNGKVVRLVDKIPFKFVRVYSKKILNISKKRIRLSTISEVFFITGIVWFFYFLSNYLFFNYAYDFNLTVYQIIVVVLVSMVVMSIPLTPGGIGIYHASAVAILTFYGVDKEMALVSSFLFHITGLVVSGIFTLIIFTINHNLYTIWKKR